MPYCANCGQPLNGGENFCPNCGIKSGDGSRRQVFEGEIHKCPNCGEPINAFTADCPSCGFEIRGAKPALSVYELSQKIEEIEAQRSIPKHGKSKHKHGLDQIDEQKISLISCFPIPNTKEDLLEFTFLAYSNIQPRLYRMSNEEDSSFQLSEAWRAKFEQAYQKAKLSFSDDSQFVRIEELHNQISSKIKKSRRSVWLWLVYIPAFYILLILLIAIPLSITVPRAKAAEQERLNSIVIEIEQQISEHEYKLALMNTEYLDYGENDQDEKRKWRIKKQYYIDRILEEAEEHGVILEYTPPEEKAEEPNSITTDFIDGFVNGFTDSIKQSTDNIDSNVEKFNDIISNSQSDS